MEATYVHQGDRIDHTPSVALAAGQVVDLGVMVGVATEPIAAGEPGSLAIEGVFDFAKASALVVAVGDILYWDEATNQATKTQADGEAVIGRAMRAAVDGDTAVRVKLLPALG